MVVGRGRERAHMCDMAHAIQGWEKHISMQYIAKFSITIIYFMRKANNKSDIALNKATIIVYRVNIAIIYCLICIINIFLEMQIKRGKRFEKR